VAGPLVLILLVTAADSADPVTRGIAAAARSALGPDARVVLRNCPGPPNDQQALDLEASEHADAVAELRWPQAHHREAALRMHVASTNAWIDRRVDFHRADADAERERTLAFAMVAILPEPPGSSNLGGNDADAGTASGANATHRGDSANEDDETEMPPAPGARDAGGDAGGGGTGTRGAEAIPAGRQNSSGPAPDSVPAATPTVPSSMGLEVLVVDAAGDGEGAQEIGGAGAFEWFVWRNVSVRVGGSVRDTSLDAASGDLLKVVGSAGLALHPWRTTKAHPFGASVRIDYLLLYERLSPVEPPGQNVPARDAVQSGCDAMLDGSWLFAPSVEAIGGAGIEAFAPTSIVEGGARIASLPVARAVFEGGLRLRF
jgi:hypothetical protein